MELQAWM